jgi:hypothetical protein
MLPALSPKLRLIAVEVTGAGPTRVFGLEAERLYEKKVLASTAPAMAGMDGMPTMPGTDGAP